MIYLGVACLLLFAYIAWQDEKFKREREAFAREREVWVRERRDLNTRIQAPEAAPYMLENPIEDDGENDLPTLPDFVVDETEMERAKQTLQEAGYEEGLVG